MILESTNELFKNTYWITLIAVVLSSASGILKDSSKQPDLFGVIMIAITTGLGGGSLRDMLLDREVFWIQDQVFFIAAVLGALLTFIFARFITTLPKYFLVADAAGLATFSIAGTLVSLMMGTPPLIASFMGVITGVMGGILRDVICNEQPVIFLGTLYATVSWLGSLMFVGMLYLNIDLTISAVVTASSMFIVRLLAIYFDIGLPKLKFKT